MIPVTLYKEKFWRSLPTLRSLTESLYVYLYRGDFYMTFNYSILSNFYLLIPMTIRYNWNTFIWALISQEGLKHGLNLWRSLTRIWSNLNCTHTLALWKSHIHNTQVLSTVLLIDYCKFLKYSWRLGWKG